MSVPESLTIESTSFKSCTSLRQIITPMGKLVYFNCAHLDAIALPTSVTSIGDLAFSNCRALTSLSIPESVTHLAPLAFKECAQLGALLKIAPSFHLVQKNFHVFPKYHAVDKSSPLIGAIESAAVIGTNAVVDELVALADRFRKEIEGERQGWGSWLGGGNGSRKLQEIESMPPSEAASCKRDILFKLAGVSFPSVLPLLARIELAFVMSLRNHTPPRPEVPPHFQPRAPRLKSVGLVLQNSMLQYPPCGEEGGGLSEDNPQKNSLHTIAPQACTSVVAVIDGEFAQTARDHFEECVQQAQTIASTMEAQYHRLRKGHRAIYVDTLKQMQQEKAFPELQRLSTKLSVKEPRCQKPALQAAKTVGELCMDGEQVSRRFQAFVSDLHTRVTITGTGARLVGRDSVNSSGSAVAMSTSSDGGDSVVAHTIPRMDLLRVCEKLSLTPEPHHWKVDHLQDVVSGVIECKDVATLISVLRLLCSLDSGLKDCGRKVGGIFTSTTAFTRESMVGGDEGDIDHITITRFRDHILRPTASGWADLIINFHFQDDARAHICELRLVHMDMYNAYTWNTGADFCTALTMGHSSLLELSEMACVIDIAADVETAEAKTLVYSSSDVLIAPKKPKQQNSQEAPLAVQVGSLKLRVATLEAEVEARELEVSGLKFQVADMETNNLRVYSLEAQVAKLEAELRRNNLRYYSEQGIL
jgi:hypothetical protein